MQRKKSYHLRYRKVEGNVREVLTELVHEKIKCALSANGKYRYYGVAIPVSHYITYQGEVGNEQGSGVCQGEYNEGRAEAQSRTSKDEV
jgi:hypothetical protein